MGREYNLLTEELLFLGYSKEKCLEYVEGSPEDHDGGFRYKRSFLKEQFFQTGCGLYAREKDCVSELWTGETQWCFENDNVLVKCPYCKETCEKNHAALQSLQATYGFCSCFMTESYSYDNSLEKILKDRRETMELLYEQYALQLGGKICRAHMYYDKKAQKWSFRYDPMKCIRGCGHTFCPLLERNLSSKKGNVYYDVRVSTRRKDGTLFDGEPVIHIIKGKKFLKRCISLDICREIAEHSVNEIYSKEWWNGYSMQKIYDPDLEIEIINVRAAQREHKDPAQDRKDEKSGILVIHESDRLKADRLRKKERRVYRLERLEKKIQKKGYKSLNDAERRVAEKRFGKEKIKNLEAAREKEMMRNGEQLSLML